MKEIKKVLCTIIENEQSEILCTLNSDNDIFSNFYGLPGTILNNGKFFEKTISEYINNQFGLEIEVNSLFAATTYEYDSHILNLIVAKSTLITSTSFIEENANFLWIPIENIKSLSWHKSLIPTINKLIVKHKRSSLSA